MNTGRDRKQAKQKHLILKDERTKDVRPAVGCWIKTHLESVSKYGGKMLAMSPEQFSEWRQERCQREDNQALCLLASEQRVAPQRPREDSKQKKERMEPEDSERHARGEALPGSRCPRGALPSSDSTSGLQTRQSSLGKRPDTGSHTVTPEPSPLAADCGNSM